MGVRLLDSKYVGKVIMFTISEHEEWCEDTGERTTPLKMLSGPYDGLFCGLFTQSTYSDGYGRMCAIYLRGYPSLGEGRQYDCSTLRDPSWCGKWPGCQRTLSLRLATYVEFARAKKDGHLTDSMLYRKR